MVKDKSKIDPKTKKPVVTLKYEPTMFAKEVPLKKFKKDLLDNMKGWYFDSKTYEAVMYDHNHYEIMRIYEPLHLVNFCKKDLLKLNSVNIWIPKDFQSPALRYRNAVSLCLKIGLHSDCDFYKAADDSEEVQKKKKADPKKQRK